MPEDALALRKPRENAVDKAFAEQVSLNGDSLTHTARLKQDAKVNHLAGIPRVMHHDRSLLRRAEFLQHFGLVLARCMPVQSDGYFQAGFSRRNSCNNGGKMARLALAYGRWQ